MIISMFNTVGRSMTDCINRPATVYTATAVGAWLPVWLYDGHRPAAVAAGSPRLRHGLLNHRPGVVPLHPRSALRRPPAGDNPVGRHPRRQQERSRPHQTGHRSRQASAFRPSLTSSRTHAGTQIKTTDCYRF